MCTTCGTLFIEIWVLHKLYNLQIWYFKGVFHLKWTFYLFFKLLPLQLFVFGLDILGKAPKGYLFTNVYKLLDSRGVVSLLQHTSRPPCTLTYQGKQVLSSYKWSNIN